MPFYFNGDMDPAQEEGRFPIAPVSANYADNVKAFINITNINSPANAFFLGQHECSLYHCYRLAPTRYELCSCRATFSSIVLEDRFFSE